MRIARCILVLSAEKLNNVLKSAVVAATFNRQLVYFEEGIVKDICQLPFEAPEDIQVVNTGRNGCLFVVSFDQGHVCAVWKETFQIASQWSGVSSVHVDDFLGCGTDQLLLVFNNQGVEGQQLDNFLITDLCGTSYSRDQENGALKTSHHRSENHLLTLYALEARLETGLTTLQELQREVRVKERVVLQALKALTDVVSAKEPTFTQYEQENLIPLWDFDGESKDEGFDDEMHNMPAVPSKPQIDKLWHRVIKDQMAVGVILRTDSSIPVDSVSLSILTAMGQSSMPAVIQTQSQVFLLPTFSLCSSSTSSSSSTLTEPAAKRSKQHNADSPNDLNTCRLAVTAVTRLAPMLNSGFVKCPVMLHYVQRPNSSPIVSNPTPVVLHCGQAALDIHRDSPIQLLSNPKLKTDEVREDLLSLLAVLDQWVFHIDSPDHSLGDVGGWMERRMGCETIEVSPQYLLFNSSAPSAVMLLRWHQETPFQGELSVHSSELQMLQFLDLLLSHLPAFCSIQPLQCTRGQGASQTFTLALEKEVLSLRECVSSLLCEKEEDEERGRNIRLRHEKTSEIGLQQCREAWQRDLERSKKSPLVDVGRYRRLIQNLSKVQLEADMAALQDTQFCLASML
ncbi:hypothetical protein LDENG_00143640 [Lucifuga dentata]|nr:hypothetical protein LDENG_00143640 [Lucifuga dentata]